jgi:hypothetical protein
MIAGMIFRGLKRNKSVKAIDNNEVSKLTREVFPLKDQNKCIER